MLKRLTRSDTGQRVLSWLLAHVIRLVGWSTRWEWQGEEHERAILRSGSPAIMVFWHSRIMLMVHGWRSDRKLTMLQSPHPDGRLIARAINRLGFLTVWGSSTKGKGGAVGLRNLVRKVRAGVYVGITPDGPRGPRMRMSPGAIALAQMTGAPIVPIAWNVERRTVLNTWDRFILAWPFSRGLLVIGAPIQVPRQLDEAGFERYRLLVEHQLNELCDRTDRHFGHVPIEPDEPRKAPAVRPDAEREQTA